METRFNSFQNPMGINKIPYGYEMKFFLQSNPTNKGVEITIYILFGYSPPHFSSKESLFLNMTFLKLSWDDTCKFPENM